MNLFKKINIRTKLFILNTIMILSILIVGCIGYYSNSVTNKALKNIYKQNLSTITLLSDARTQSRANYANIINLMLVTDSASQKTILSDIEQRKIAIEKDFKDFENTDIDAKEASLYQTVQDNMVTWEKIFNQYIDLATSGKSDEAAALFKENGKNTFENLQTSIKNLLKYDITLADNTYKSNEKTAIQTTVNLSVIIVLSSVLCLLLGFYIAGTITRPINRIVNLIKKTSDLELDYDSSFDSLFKYKGEIGVIAQSVETMRNVLRDMANKIIEISGNLAASSEELTASTDENAKTINQVVTAINEIAAGNGNQAETVVKVNDTIINISHRIDDVNKATSLNVSHAESSLTVIAQGQEAVDFTNKKIRDNIEIAGIVNQSISELTTQMEKVTNITDVINSIASQTNLLALNAAIEAARAGEAGKGFAVVAEEIRNLAEGSSKAVKDITEIINGAVMKSSEAAHNMEQSQKIAIEQENAIISTREAFDKINNSVESIVKQMKSVAEMLIQIDTSAKEITIQTQDMASVAEQSAASSEEISASSEEQLASTEIIAKAASELSGMAVDLKNEISKFKI